MNDRFVQSQIKTLPLFEYLSQEQFLLVAREFQVLRYEPGTLVLRQGQPSQGLMLFAGGRGMLTQYDINGVENTVGVVNAGDVLNEEAVYQQTVEPASLRIVETSIVLFLSRRKLLELVTQYPELRANLRIQRGQTERESGKRLFKGQRSDETVITVFRPHWWSYARHLWIPLLVGTLFIVGAILALNSAPALAITLLGLGIIIAGVLVFYLYYEWQNDSIVLTDQRIVHIWVTLASFQRTVNEVPLDRVLEVNVTIPPASPTAQLFDYGNVFVKTAGDVANMTLRMIGKPRELQQRIFHQRDIQRQVNERKTQEEIRSAVEKALGIGGGMTESTPAPAQGGHLPDKSSDLPFPLVRTRFINGEGHLVFRKHWTVWMGHITLPVLVMLVGPLLFVLSVAIPGFPLPQTIILPIAAVLVIIGAILYYMADWDWRNDMMILSDQSITFIRKRPLWLQNELEQIRLSQVDNVISDVTGITANLLNVGTIRVSLIGSDQTKSFRSIYDPQEIQAEISRRQAALRTNQQQGTMEQQRQVFAEYLAAYHQMAPNSGVPGDPAASAYTQANQPIHEAPTSRQPTVDLEPPPPPVRDSVRPPRIPRLRPEDLD